MTPRRLLFAASLALALAPAARAADAAAPLAAASAASAAMPSVARPWSPEDYTLAVDLVADRQVPLPTYESPQGRALLDKFTSPDNYAIFTDETIPLLARLQRSSAVLGGVGRLMVAYGEFVETASKPLHAEMAALIVTVLTMSALESDLAGKRFVQLDPADPRVMGARAKFGEGLEGIVGGVAEAIALKDFFVPSETTIELRTMASTVASINVFLAPEVRTALAAKFAALRKTATPAEDQASLDRIVATLKG